MVLETVRDTHDAVAGRVHGVLARTSGRTALVPAVVAAAAASTVYGSLGLGLRAAAVGLEVVGDAGIGPRWDEGPRARWTRAAVNGIVGDRLHQDRSRLAIAMSLRAAGEDVEPVPDALRAAYPTANGSLTVFVHGLSESETNWDRHRDQVGRAYADTVAEQGWTPLFIRANTGLSVRENGVALASLLDRLMDSWPVEVERIALVGHSMGGLIIRTACGVAVSEPSGHRSSTPWPARVTEVITLGTPHLGAPLARRVSDSSQLLARLPETAALARVLDRRSEGVIDLVEGLDEEVPALPHVRYRLVSATLTREPQHLAGRLIGDGLVRPSSAHGTASGGRRLFPDAELLHLPASSHFDLLNHADVHEALRRWLG